MSSSPDERDVWPLTAVILVGLLLARADLLIGRSTFFLRDLQTTHAPALAAFYTLGFSRLNPFASFGQPYLGNPSLLVAYPFPKDPHLVSLHLLLHLALALVGMVVLLRSLELSPDAAWFGALAFALSGYVLSAASSLNAATTIAWIPLVLWSAHREQAERRSWRARAPAVLLLAVFLVSGEPVLIGATLALALLMLHPWRRERLWSALHFAICVLIATIVTAPVHFQTWRAARTSFRVVRGYGFERAAAASLHPARLLELVDPFLFGDPGRIGPGAFWGYEVSNDTRPYVYTLAISGAALCLALVAAARAVRSHRTWISVAGATLLLSFGGFLPGARWLYAAVPLLHVVRFPIKFFLFFTLSVSILAAYAFQDLISTPTSREGRRRVAVGLAIVSGVLFATALIAALTAPWIQRGLVALWWNNSWVAAPDLVLPPITAAIPVRLFVASGAVGATAWAIIRGGGAVGRAVLHVMVAGEGLALAASLLPTVPASVYEEPSELVRAAAALDTRVFERARKDLDTVKTGIRGTYPGNDVRFLARAQARQGWSLSGVRHRLRYAFDPSPDGSYTDRNQTVQDLLETLDWPRRIKWLRGAGVGAIITSDRLGRLATLRLLMTDGEIGVPVGLYALQGPLPEVRRPRDAVAAGSTTEAIDRFNATSFDESEAIVVEGGAPVEGGGGTARVVRATADSMDIETEGPEAGYVFVARAFTPYITARDADGRSFAVVPANVAFIAVLMPAEPVRVHVTF